MANISQTGFKLVKNPGGSGIAQPMEHIVATGWAGTCNAIAVNMNVGDLVCILANGTVDFAAAGTAYAVSTRWYGVVSGIVQYWDGTLIQRGLRNCIPNATAYGALVERESRVLVTPFKDGQIWEVEFDGVPGMTTRAAYKACVGGNVDVLLTRANLASGRANLCLDDTTVAVTNTLPFRILDIPDDTVLGPQDWAATYVKAYVNANLAQQIPVGTTTGI